jgi:hypothetical protein
MTVQLGLELMVAGYAIEGELREREAKTLLREIVRLIDMTPVGRPFVKRFPTPDGLGGVGETVAQAFTTAQPLVFQSLAESYSFILPGIIPLDAWPEHLKPRGGSYLVVVSCRRFPEGKVEDYPGSKGFRVVSKGTMLLKLDGGETQV